MKLINNTDFSFACMPGRMNYPGHSLTLIVKGTFALSPGQKATLAKEQDYPTGEEYYPDDEDMLGSPRYESDFACFKPHADLLLVGKCYVPDGKQAQSCAATFQVGNKSASVVVFGNRHWKRNALGFRYATDPEPFTSLDLRYENSFGGAGDDQNPIGKGRVKVTDESGVVFLPLPNIENPLRLIDSPHTHPEPAGFGPIRRDWEQRRAKMGTYRRGYAKERWPWFPDDFDWTHFNAAPPEMQLEGYLRGDESLCFENLHPAHAKYESQLPGLRVRCFVNKSIDPANNPADFVEVPMNLDTLWVDMESEKMVLVWRGWIETASEEHEDIQHVFITSEQLDAPAEPVSTCHQQFLAALVEEGLLPEAEVEQPEAASEAQSEAAKEMDRPEPQKSDAAETEKEEQERRELAQQIESQTAKLLSQAGISIEALPSELKQKLAEQQSRMIGILTNKNPAARAAEEEAKQKAELSKAFSQLGLDPNHLPAMSEKARSEQLRFMKELGLESSPLAGNQEFLEFSTMMAAILPKAGIDPENLDPLIAEVKKHKLRIEEHPSAADSQKGEKENAAEEPAPVSGPLTRELVQERAERGESFAGEDLRNLDLSGLQLNGLDFSGAVLAGTSLKRAFLEDANLTEANLEGADLSGARLNRAILVKANLTNSNVSAASLEEIDATEAAFDDSNLEGSAIGNAVFERAKMTNARLDGAKGNGAIFAEADLSGSSFRGSALPQADFSRTVLHNCDFQDADLTDSNIEAATGRKANFRKATLSGLRASEGCDFSEACFTRVSAPGAYWENATLQGADFSYALLESANFCGASLQGANFCAANAKFGRFMKANLAGAVLVQMNLFEGTLEKANLTETDLSGSNLYGAEFLNCHLERTKLDNANLKMTKLEKG